MKAKKKSEPAAKPQRKKPQAEQATPATVQQRVQDVLRIRLDGAEGWDVRQYVAEKEAAGEAPWKVEEGGKGLSERQIRNYVQAADKLIGASCRQSRKKLLRRHLAQRRSLYAKAVNGADIRTALAVLRDEAELLDLYAVHDGPEAGNDASMDTADVVKVLAARLRQLDAAELPTGEKARLTASLADALLRAISADVLNKRIEAIQAVLLGRKDKG